MKPILALGLSLLVGASAHAQVLRPEAVNGAVLGGIAGAIVGHNSGDLGHNAWRGAAYGAGAGLLIGAIVGDEHDRRMAHRVPVPAYPRTYVCRRGSGYSYDYGYRGRPPYAYYAGPGYGYYAGSTYYDDSYYADTGTDYAGNGLLLGALAGAVIGNNSGGLRHNAWRGAALGATTGYLLGSIADSNARRRAAALTEQTAAAGTNEIAAESAVVAAPTAPQAPTAPAAPIAPASPMAAANSLFGR